MIASLPASPPEHLEARADVRSSRAQRLRTAAIVVGAWTVFSLFFATREYAIHVDTGKPLDWRRVLGWLVTGYIWAGLTPLIRRLALRYPFRTHTWKLSLVVHLTASVVVSLLELLLTVVGHGFLIYRDFSSLGEVFAAYKRYVALDIQVQIWVYWVVVAVVHVLDNYSMYLRREREAYGFALRAARLEGQLARAQLGALRMQLHPHFLFNALHSVTVLIRRGSYAEADDMLVGLADLLRASLDSDGRQEISLREELRLVERYLDIQRIRFGPRLRVEYSVPEQTMAVLVPSFLLQPLVENALRHGLGESINGGTIQIRARLSSDVLTLEVHDDGAGVRGSTHGAGVGLASVRARLQHVYGDQSSFELHQLPHGGTCARITIPCQPPKEPRVAS